MCVRSWAVHSVGAGTPVARPQTFFHGSEIEASELEAAIRHNCECTFNDDGSMNDMCKPHRMMLDDQRALDGLLFMRKQVKKLREGEGIDQDVP